METKYPKLIAAGLVKRGDKLLLAKEVNSRGEEKWLVPGGKVEFGETLEDAVVREVQEEVGVQTKIIQFLGYKEAVFPEHGYHTIIFFYLLSPESGEIKTEDGVVMEAKYFTKDEALDLDLMDSARWLISEFKL